MSVKILLCLILPLNLCARLNNCHIDGQNISLLLKIVFWFVDATIQINCRRDHTVFLDHQIRG